MSQPSSVLFLESGADGELTSDNAERLKLTKAIVGKWSARFTEWRNAGP